MIEVDLAIILKPLHLFDENEISTAPSSHITRHAWGITFDVTLLGWFMLEWSYKFIIRLE